MSRMTSKFGPIRPFTAELAAIERLCYEMDKTSISMFEILEPGGQLWANTAFEGSQFYSIGVPKFYSWVNVISVYVYNDLG